MAQDPQAPLIRKGVDNGKIGSTVAGLEELFGEACVGERIGAELYESCIQDSNITTILTNVLS
jgi:hypothetical protein